LKFFRGEISGWVDVVDLAVTLELARQQNLNNFLEIGVYKGGFSLNMLQNLESFQAYLIDPYTNMPEIKKCFQDFAVEARLAKSYKLFETIESFQKEENPDFFNFIHIDGAHDQNSVTKDLEFAFGLLNNAPPNYKPFIIVDDIYHGDFPGLTAAVFHFVLSNDISSFCLSRNKIYLCKPSDYEYFFTQLLLILENSSIRYSLGIDTDDSSAYKQPNNIKGNRQIVIGEQTTKVYDKLQNIKKGEYASRYIRKFVSNLLPPFFSLVISRLLKIIHSF
jgi:hypothetical protein